MDRNNNISRILSKLDKLEAKIKSLENQPKKEVIIKEKSPNSLKGYGELSSRILKLEKKVGDLIEENKEIIERLDLIDKIVEDNQKVCSTFNSLKIDIIEKMRRSEREIYLFIKTIKEKLNIELDIPEDK